MLLHYVKATSSYNVEQFSSLNSTDKSFKRVNRDNKQRKYWSRGEESMTQDGCAGARRCDVEV